MTKANGARRVVVTGMGAVTPIGLDVDEFWTSIKKGRCGVSRIENWPLDDLYIHIAGEIKGFDPAKHVKSRKVQYGERYSWFAGRAADEAWTQAGLPTPYDEPYRAAASSARAPAATPPSSWPIATSSSTTSARQTR